MAADHGGFAVMKIFEHAVKAPYVILEFCNTQVGERKERSKQSFPVHLLAEVLQGRLGEQPSPEAAELLSAGLEH